MSEGRRIPAPRDMPPGRLLARKSHLVSELIGAPEGVRRPGRARVFAPPGSIVARRRGPSRRMVVALFVPVVLLAAGFTAYRLIAPAANEVTGGVACYDGPSLDANAAIFEADGRAPTTVCADEWSSAFVALVPASFVACSGEGVVDVFPGGDPGLCGRLGLAPLPPGYETAAADFASMRDALVAAFGERACLHETDARATARQILDQHGFEDWTIQSNGFSDVQPCAAPSFDAQGHAVHLQGELAPAFDRAVAGALRQDGCDGADTALTAVREALSEAGYTGWTVRVEQGPTLAEPCLTWGVSVPLRMVELYRTAPVS